MDLSPLSRFSNSETNGSEWQPLVLDDLAQGSVLAFDQSLSATGWVTMFNGIGGVVVTGAGTLANMGDPLKGNARTLARSHELRTQVESLVWQIPPAETFSARVFESPPSAGRSVRPESSLLAAHVLGSVFRPESLTMIQAQHVKKIITGNGNAKKPEVKKALMAMTWIVGLFMVTNEHQRDALSLALTYLADQKEASCAQK